MLNNIVFISSVFRKAINFCNISLLTPSGNETDTKYHTLIQSAGASSIWGTLRYIHSDCEKDERFVMISHSAVVFWFKMTKV